VRLQQKKKRNSSLKTVTEHTEKWSKFELNLLPIEKDQKSNHYGDRKSKRSSHPVSKPNPWKFLGIKVLAESDLRGDSGIGLMEDR